MGYFSIADFLFSICPRWTTKFKKLNYTSSSCIYYVYYKKLKNYPHVLFLHNEKHAHVMIKLLHFCGVHSEATYYFEN